MDEAAQLVGAILRLDAERVLLGAQATRARRRHKPVPAGTLMQLDEEAGTLMSGLERRGVAYPGLVLAGRYGLSDGEYTLLQLALMPLHANELLRGVRAALDGPDEKPRLSYGLAIIALDDDPAAVLAELREMPLLAEQLVTLVPLGDDAELRPSQAVVELYGLPV